jgi:hypothetical protein
MTRPKTSGRVLESAIADLRLHKLARVKQYRAWKLGALGPAAPIELGDAATLDDAKAAIVAKHKDTVFIHEADGGRGVNAVHAYRIRQGARVYRKNPVSGLAEPYHPLTPDHLFTLPVDEFEPTRPFDALRDDPVGVDRNFVEASPE